MKRRTIISSFFGEIIRRGRLVGEAKRAQQGAGVVMLGAVVLCVVAGVAALTPAEAGALSYQKKVPVQFTFNTSLEVSLSSADLVINDLAPGTSADSNIVTVTVLSNSLAGYSLGATVGDDEEANPDGAIYNTDALIHTTYTTDDNANIADKKYEKPFFANLTTSQTTIMGDNTWGYSFSRDGGTNWINAHKTGDVNDAGYNGLPLYNSGTPAELKATTAPSAVGGDSVQFKIGAKAGTEQSSGEYSNVVNFVAVANPAPEPGVLYTYIAAMNKGRQSLADLQAAITKDNSGVYEYNDAVFGAASDAASDFSIYYYRGILDETVGTYGSNGDGVAYPNYVVLSAASNNTEIAATDTCWRIVRTTGSGGVKMIYNGLWNDTDKTCANAQTAAQVTTQAFGLKGNSAQATYWYRNINRVGYTFNNSSEIQDATTATDVSVVFGSNENYSSTNTENSNIKNYIEGDWFASSIGNYEPILEKSAGYCNDRTAFSDNTTNSTLTEIAPYATSGATMYFGAYGRNINATNAGKTPSLSCPRGTVDLYTASGAANGNKQLSKPVALLTADEASLAGSGRTDGTQGSAKNDNSFLRSGSVFWLLSPSYRLSGGNANGFLLNTTGYVSYNNVGSSYGVRPAISLTPGTDVAGGEGTAKEPWIVNPPNS